MTDLPIAHSWEDIQPGVEYATNPEHPLTGWRISAVAEDRTFGQPIALRVFPFARTESARNRHCNTFPSKDPEYWRKRQNDSRATDPRELHIGEKVHPECACGFHIFRTQRMAAEYASQPDHSGLQRNIFRKSNVGWAGEILCKVTTYYGAHVTGPNQNGHIGNIDPPGTLRTNMMQLDAIFVPESLTRQARILYKHYGRFDVDVFIISGSITDELEETDQ